MHTCISLSLYIYIYIYIERERDIHISCGTVQVSKSSGSCANARRISQSPNQEAIEFRSTSQSHLEAVEHSEITTSRNPEIRWHQTCCFREHTTSAAAAFGGETPNVLRNRARTQVLRQAQKLHVYGSGTFGAFGA